MAILLTNGKVLELTKIPTLLEHYHDHKLDQQQLNFCDFLFMHYIGDDANSEDDVEDQKLPFKNSTEKSQNSFDGICFLSDPRDFCFTICHLSEQVYFIPKTANLSSYTKNVFRPPVLV